MMCERRPKNKLHTQRYSEKLSHSHCTQIVVKKNYKVHMRKTFCRLLYKTCIILKYIYVLCVRIGIVNLIVILYNSPSILNI